MDNVTIKAPNNEQSFNYLYTFGINLKFIPYPIHFESANPMSIILIEKVLLVQLDKKFTPFLWNGIFLCCLHTTTPSELITRQWNLVPSSVHYLVLNERRINSQCARLNKMKFTHDVIR